MKKQKDISSFVARPKVSRPGVHAKTKTSKTKTSKNYKKQYRNGDIVDIGIDEVDDILDGWDNNDVFTDYIQDKLYDDAMTYIWNLPALCDQDNDFISVGIKIK